MVKDIENNIRKVVIKIGSNVLSDDNGFVNRGILQNIVDQVCNLKQSGRQVAIVSSGAGICGVGAINKWSRRNDMNYKQALCAIGQVELMMAYKEMFSAEDVCVAQMLLTKDDFADPERELHIRNTLFTLVDEGVVPIINENDCVSVDEIKIGDNDTLSAHAAALWNADLLIILSDIDGVFEKDPKNNPNAKLIDDVFDIDELLNAIDVRGKSPFGTGGIMTKIEAAREVNRYGIPMLLLNGKRQDSIKAAFSGERHGTFFHTQK